RAWQTPRNRRDDKRKYRPLRPLHSPPKRFPLCEISRRCIAITSDTMRLAGAGTTGSRTLAANGVATALKVTSTEWIISGTALS
ncbi:MAG TPA: hypothetical protein VFP29_12515, partial [Methyloceanibacter sp.]|nr:hypothetical protein [Methyloceanibacter sp.]